MCGVNATGDSLGETAPSQPRVRGLRLLFVTPRYLPHSGGVETHVREVALRSARAGARVTVLTTDPTGALPPEERSDGFEIRRVHAWPASKDYYLAPDIYRAITSGPWEIIHIQSFHTLVAPLAMLAALRARLPYIVTFHSGGHSFGWRNAVRGVQRRALGPLLRRADRLVAVAQFERELFARQLGLPPERIALIPNGADLPPNETSAAKPATASPTLADPTIVSIGRLERYKGHHHVIAALPAVLRQRPDARLLILGSGPYQSELARFSQRLAVADQVEIRSIPPGERAEMASVLSRATLVVCLSEYETHPVAIVEALALQRPVLVADTSGLRELAERGWAARVPLHSHSEEVAAAILGQLRQPFVPASFAPPTWDDCAEGLLRLYASIVKRDRECAS
ncbi:MAG: glycosyltransferase family 4 protein [Chloroflexi bacterium]|nr:glycosyltransferase family 4 protein [Chloroflexota bacterium]